MIKNICRAVLAIGLYAAAVISFNTSVRGVTSPMPTDSINKIAFEMASKNILFLSVISGMAGIVRLWCLRRNRNIEFWMTSAICSAVLISFGLFAITR